MRKQTLLLQRMSNNAVNQIQSKINDEVIQTVNGVAFNQLSVMGQNNTSIKLVTIILHEFEVV